MCELLAISSAMATEVSLSLEAFAGHGAASSNNKDGWGILYYDGADIRRFRDVGPAADSQWVKFVESQALRSTQVIAHIRHANVGSVRLANTHPFTRELGGQMQAFAHNGYLPGIHTHPDHRLGRFSPIGDTDSEWAFCVLLSRLSEIWLPGRPVPSISDRLEIVSEYARQIRRLGPANFLYSDGDAIFAHADRRLHDDGVLRDPGLCLRRQICRGLHQPIAGSGIEVASPEQEIVLVASVPLTERSWEPLSTGTVVTLRNGEVVGQAETA